MDHNARKLTKIRLESLTFNMLPVRGRTGRPMCPVGNPMLAGFMWTHTQFKQGSNMSLLFQNGLLIYTHLGFKGLVISAEIEVLTAALDSFWLILFLCWQGIAVSCVELNTHHIGTLY